MKGYKLLFGTGSCLNERKEVPGTLEKDGDDIVFKSDEFDINYSDENFQENLNKIATEQKKFIELYVDQETHTKYFPVIRVN